MLKKSNKRNLQIFPGLVLHETPVCVKTCPLETTSMVECMGVSKGVTTEDCALAWDFANLDAHYGYKTKSVFNKFCLPNTDGPPPEGLDFQLNSIVGDLKIDNI